MTNLLVEYRRRIGTDCIPVLHDGLCFFDAAPKADLPRLITMTSLACRPLSTCVYCDQQKGPNVIIETFQPGYAGSFQMIRHDHVEPNTDLNAYVQKNFGKHTPFYAKSPRSLEHWLWDFCYAGRKWQIKLMEKDEATKKTELMAAVAMKHPKLFNVYYIAYEAFLLSRKYMLFS